MISQRRSDRTAGFLMAALLLAVSASGGSSRDAGARKGSGPSSAAPQVCPSGSCAVPLAVLPDPTTSCQSTTLSLTCANPATYSIFLFNGQNYTFTLCPASCAGSNAAFDSRIEYALTTHVDHKTELQEALAQRGRSVSYAVLDVDGPPHDRTFTCAAVIEGEERGVGRGRSKKAAEQTAAQEALAKLAAG